MLVNSTQFIHVRGSSYIITTNYEKRRPTVMAIYVFTAYRGPQHKKFKTFAVLVYGHVYIIWSYSEAKIKSHFFIILAWLSTFKFHRPLCCRCSFNTGTTSGGSSIGRTRRTPPSLIGENIAFSCIFLNKVKLTPLFSAKMWLTPPPLVHFGSATGQRRKGRPALNQHWITHVFVT